MSRIMNINHICCIDFFDIFLLSSRKNIKLKIKLNLKNVAKLKTSFISIHHDNAFTMG